MFNGYGLIRRLYDHPAHLHLARGRQRIAAGYHWIRQPFRPKAVDHQWWARQRTVLDIRVPQLITGGKKRYNNWSFLYLLFNGFFKNVEWFDIGCGERFDLFSWLGGCSWSWWQWKRKPSSLFQVAVNSWYASYRSGHLWWCRQCRRQQEDGIRSCPW